MATSSVQGQIRAQGEVVRQLKKDKAPEEKASVWAQFRSVPMTCESVYFRILQHTIKPHVMAVLLRIWRQARAVSIMGCGLYVWPVATGGHRHGHYTCSSDRVQNL